ncbi:MAG: electron transfer flavoprotein subunit beta [Armatimonadota bacterium]|nr:electron transfer flavoprotein subunit beta [Armatimonadota bacterium]MDR5702298.1 electron transfer flavoprotein subunit beta [Armatimonadota bacterium]
MEFIVLCKLVPDLVEDLEVNSEGTDLDRQFLKLVLNEFDEHALEEALLLKEAHGGRVTVVAPEADGVDEVLYTALAKGADRVIKVTGLGEKLSNKRLAGALRNFLPSLGFDLVLTGVQAVDDLDGQVGMLLAGYLDIPHVGVVTGVELEPERKVARVRKEYAGGLLGEFEVQLPVVLGIQAARQPPRYAPITKVRQAMKEGKIEAVEGRAPLGPQIQVRRLFKPEATGHAEILEGPPEEVARRIVAVLEERGLLR